MLHLRKVIGQLMICVFVVLCSATDPVYDQVLDRWLAGQSLYIARRVGNKDFNDYLSQNHQYLIQEYQAQCGWGFYITMEKQSKTPTIGLTIQF